MLTYPRTTCRNATSILYAGTPALKGDFTRTGQRTKLGLLQDGTNSAIRYVVNNFQDHRCAAIANELMLLFFVSYGGRPRPTLVCVALPSGP